MADSAIAITAGTGTNVDTRTEATNGHHRQVIIIGDPSTNAGVAPVDATAGLKVDLGADNDVVVTNAGTFATQATLQAGSATIGKLAANSGVDIGDVDVTSSALPTGAATAAKQPALGTAGTASTDVITVQGIASMTALKVDGSAVTQPVSGTVTANLSATDNAVLDAIEADTTTIAGAIAGTEMQVDVVGALPAGTNAIGKLLPADIDVTTHTNYKKFYYTNAGAVTDGIVWSPAAGKRWHILWMIVNVSADATVTFEDDLAAGDSVVAKAEIAAKSGFPITCPEKYPLASGEDAADLLVTTSAGNVYIFGVGYEI